MSNQSTVRGSVVTALLTAFTDRGIDPGPELKKIGLRDAVLSNPYSSVPLAQYIALLDGMARRFDSPILGAQLGTKIKPRDIGPIGLVMARSESINSALSRLTRFINSLQTGTENVLRQDQDFLIWQYRLNDPMIKPNLQDAEFTLSSLVQIIRHSFQLHWRPAEVQFEHPPRSANCETEISRIFGCPVKFGTANNTILMNRSETEVCFRKEDKEMIEVLERHLINITPKLEVHDNWSDRVSALISLYLGHQPVTIPTVAHDLGTSSRTLQRRLASEGTSLRDLMQTHRQKLSSQQTESHHVNLEKLAERLGYADGTTFWRARRNWSLTS